MSTKRKAWLSPVASQSINKGRPTSKGYSIEDAVKMVSASFASRGQSLPYFGENFLCEMQNLGLGIRTFYTNRVLIFFSQVVDNRLQLDQALWACRLHKTVNVQTLHYSVQKELKLRVELSEILTNHGYFPKNLRVLFH